MNKALFLGTLLSVGTAATANAMTCAQLQTEISAGGVVTVDGDVICGSTETLSVTTNSTAITGMGRIISSASPAIEMNATNVVLRDIEIDARGTSGNSTGKGVEIIGGGRYRLNNVTVRSSSVAIEADNGAGLWMSGVHTDSVGQSGSVGIRVGEWDTVYVSDTLMEEHDTAIRLGWGGNTANFFMSDVVMDRNITVGLWLEPQSGYSIANVQASNLWGASAASTNAYPAIISGNVENVQIANGRFSNSNKLSIPVTGVPNASNIQLNHMIFFN